MSKRRMNVTHRLNDHNLGTNQSSLVSYRINSHQLNHRAAEREETILEQEFPDEEDLGGHTVHHWLCPGCKRMYAIPRHCGSRSCEICRQVQAFRFYRNYAPLIESFSDDELSHYVFTIKNHERLVIAYEKLTRSLEKLRRRKVVKEAWSGGMIVIEVTHRGKGWHAHAHMITSGLRLDESVLRNLWSEITGDSHIVRAEAVRHRIRIFWYLLKGYFSRSIHNDQIEEFDKYMKSKHLIRVFGDWRGQKTEYSRRSVCKECR